MPAQAAGNAEDIHELPSGAVAPDAERIAPAAAILPRPCAS
jgi:hypothetical protein